MVSFKKVHILHCLLQRSLKLIKVNTAAYIMRAKTEASKVSSLRILTCTKASSPNKEQDKVGVVPRNPESVTSSTVSPIDNTSVAFTKDTMM